MLKLSFGGTEKMNDDAMLAANDPAIKPALNFYKYVEAHHVAVFFITGRNEWLKKATIKNLKAAGYTKWNGLYLAPNNYSKKSIIPFKSAERKMIEGKGYDIILTIGDQYSDLNGGYADHKIKLPDPFYYIP
jgi:predicted secreted acid phosphatase